MVQVTLLCKPDVQVVISNGMQQRNFALITKASALLFLLLLGRVALYSVKAVYSYWTFLSTICWSLCLSDQIWMRFGDGRSDGSRDEAGSWVWGSVYRRVYFVGVYGVPHCNQWGVWGIAVQKCMNRWSCSLRVLREFSRGIGGNAACSQITLFLLSSFWWSGQLRLANGMSIYHE